MVSEPHQIVQDLLKDRAEYIRYADIHVITTCERSSNEYSSYEISIKPSSTNEHSINETDEELDLIEQFYKFDST